MQIRRFPPLFWLILLLFLLYSSLFIFRTTFVIDGERYFTLFDDAMVSMRYARNLAHGRGPVWNPGEKVEGYTNPFWMLYMTLFHFLPIPPSKISLCLQVSGALFLMLTLPFIYRIANIFSPGKPPVSLGAVFLTSFYYPVLNWSLQGMEVSVLLLLLYAVVWQAIRTTGNPEFPATIYPLLATALLIRMDLLLPGIAIIFWLVFVQKQWGLRHAGFAFLWMGGALLALTLFRIFYYGDWLPNTYYLKLTGFPWYYRISRGFFVFGWFAWHMNWILFLLPFSVLLFRRDSLTVLLLLLFGVQVAYSIYAGGDAWEGSGGANRFIVLAMPSFFILLSYAIYELTSWFLSRSHLYCFRYQITALLLLLSLVSLNSFNPPKSLFQWLLIQRPLNIDDHYYALQISRILKKETPPDAKIAVVWAGVVPYFTDRYCIDLLGKSDRYIARLPAKMHSTHERLEKENMQLPSWLFRWISYYPGHQKWDYAYSIGHLKPDVIVQLYRKPEQARPWLKDYELRTIQGISLYFRRPPMQ